MIYKVQYNYNYNRQIYNYAVLIAAEKEDNMLKGKGKSAIIMVLIAAATTAMVSGCGKKVASDNKLTYFAALTAAHAGATVDNLADTPLYQKLREITGVEVEFIHPVSGQEKEQLNLLIASQSLPDIVEYNWNLNYPGGAQKAIDDKVIIPIDQFMDKEAKDLKALLENDTEYGYDKMVKTQNGQYYIFPFLRGDKRLVTFQGPVVRADWLKDSGLDTPKTIDDWDKMLAAFKSRGSDVIPLSFQWNHVFTSRTFLGAFGVMKDFYEDNGKIVYGPIEPGYKEFLGKMREWYQKGYIDKDFSTQTTDNLEAKIMSGKVGASILMAGSQVGKIVKNNNENNLGMEFAGVPYPSLKAGEVARFGHRDNMFNGFGAAITTSCKDPALAAEWLNYGYTDEGHALYNFGIEGESYTLVDGKPIYTDYVLNNPDGLSFGAAGGRYMRSMGDGPFVQDIGYFFQYCSLPEQQGAVNTWSEADNTGILPMLSTDEEDSKRLATIMNDVDTAVSEYSLKVILGQDSLDRFDDFVAECKRMGIDEAISIKEKAYKNYNSR